MKSVVLTVAITFSKEQKNEKTFLSTTLLFLFTSLFSYENHTLFQESGSIPDSVGANSSRFNYKKA